MQLNTPPARRVTHEGAPAKTVSPIMELRRSVLSCLLWEDGFYESGNAVADRIVSLIPKCEPMEVMALALQARSQFKLRHVPLLIAATMAGLSTHKRLVAATIDAVIQRPDELTEFVAIYWRKGRCPLSAQVKKGLARAFTKFNEFQLARYNRDSAIKLRDVLFMCHAKPKDREQRDLWKRLIDGNLATPDTWETALSSGADKKETWVRLLSENRLGALALLRNLRNMTEAGVPDDIIRAALTGMKADRVLPFRFVSAAHHAHRFEPELEQAMFKCLEGASKLSGHTLLLVDVSGSMIYSNVSSRSELTRLDAACALAMLLREICSPADVMTFDTSVHSVPPRRGFALRDAIRAEQGGGTRLGKAVSHANSLPHDRLIVLTDEQSSDSVPDPVAEKAYMINVATNRNGVGYGRWTHIDGWSESIVDFIRSLEAERAE